MSLIPLLHSLAALISSLNLQIVPQIILDSCGRSAELLLGHESQSVQVRNESVKISFLISLVKASSCLCGLRLQRWEVNGRNELVSGWVICLKHCMQPSIACSGRFFPSEFAIVRASFCLWFGRIWPKKHFHIFQLFIIAVVRVKFSLASLLYLPHFGPD